MAIPQFCEIMHLNPACLCDKVTYIKLNNKINKSLFFRHMKTHDTAVQAARS